MITCYPPVVEKKAKEPGRLPMEEASTLISETERVALQELADRHGIRWRTALLDAHARGSLKGVLKRLMSQPEAGNKIARAVIIPRSLPPAALYYGPLHFV